MKWPHAGSKMPVLVRCVVDGFPTSRTHHTAGAQEALLCDLIWGAIRVGLEWDGVGAPYICFTPLFWNLSGPSPMEAPMLPTPRRGPLPRASLPLLLVRPPSGTHRKA